MSAYAETSATADGKRAHLLNHSAGTTTGSPATLWGPGNHVPAFSLAIRRLNQCCTAAIASAVSATVSLTPTGEKMNGKPKQKVSHRFAILVERVRLAAIAHCRAGGVRLSCMAEFAEKFGDPQKSKPAVEDECVRILKNGITPENARPTLDWLLQLRTDAGKVNLPKQFPMARDHHLQ